MNAPKFRLKPLALRLTKQLIRIQKHILGYKKRKYYNFERSIILSSGLFDEHWYIFNNSDLKNFSGHPVDHYLKHGAKEGRSAGPHFPTRAYQIANPETLDSKCNPLVHYLCTGAREGFLFEYKKIDRFETSYTGMGNISTTSLRRGLPTFKLILGPGTDSAMRRTLQSMCLLYGMRFSVSIIRSSNSGWRSSTAFRKLSTMVDVHEIGEADRHLAVESAVRESREFYIAFVQPGSELRPTVLLEVASFINRNNSDVVYFHQIFESKSNETYQLDRKPRWSPELLRSYNYFSDPTFIRNCIALKVVDLTDTFYSLRQSSAIAWNLNLRSTEIAHQIHCLPKVLSLRVIADFRSELPFYGNLSESMMVLKKFLMRDNAEVELKAVGIGVYYPTWHVEQSVFVSIIIFLGSDHIINQKMLRFLSEATFYTKTEVILLGTLSRDAIEEQINEYSWKISIRAVFVDPSFGKYAARNHGAISAEGEYLLFLDINFTIERTQWLAELVRFALEPGVGLVGFDPRVLVSSDIDRSRKRYKSRTQLEELYAIGSSFNQIASVAIGNTLSISDDCLLVRRSVFEIVGGYRDDFRSDHAGTIMSIHALMLGFRTVHVPWLSSGGKSDHTTSSQTVNSDNFKLAYYLKRAALSTNPYSYLPYIWKNSADTFKVNADKNMDDFHRTQIEKLTGLAKGPIDLYDQGSVANICGENWSSDEWYLCGRDLVPGVRAGVWIVITILRIREDLRKRFPFSFRDGSDGPFATWVKIEGLSLLGLGPEFQASIDDAYRTRFGTKSRNFLLNDKNLAKIEPLFLLPEGRRACCQVLFSAARDGLLTLEDIWWFLLSNAESPVSALCQTWATTPFWQEAVPDGGTIFGIERLVRWVAENYILINQNIYLSEIPTVLDMASQFRLSYQNNTLWQENFPLGLERECEADKLIDYLLREDGQLNPAARSWLEKKERVKLRKDICQSGINILGHFTHPSGLRVSAESLVDGLRENGFAASKRNVPVSDLNDEEWKDDLLGFETYNTTLIHIQPEPFFEKVYQRAKMSPRSRRSYRIAYWYWEFDQVPLSWRSIANTCDEVWTATEFVARGLRQRLSVPVHVLPPGFEVRPFNMKTREYFHIKDGDFVFLYVFSMKSVVERKNPLGVIEAFKAAFSKRGNVRLIIKTSFGSEHPEDLARLHSVSHGFNIDIVDRIFDRDETLSLISVSDAYISLHRSEGLGLTMAEAMLLGRPVIATNYSGNLEFMNSSNSLLVDCELMELEHSYGPYEIGQRWAMPSIAHAAAMMRKLFDNPEMAKKIGIAGLESAKNHLNYRRSGLRIIGRLNAIRAEQNF